MVIQLHELSDDEDGIEAQNLDEEQNFDERDMDEDTIWEEEQDLQGDLEEPTKGMIFELKDLLLLFYKNYAKRKRFVVIVNQTTYKKNGRKYVTYGCNRGGAPRREQKDPLRQQPTTKTKCKASISASSCAENVWVLTSINLDHNHDLCVIKAKYLKCNRYLPTNVKKGLELHGAAGIKMAQTINSCRIESRGPHKLTWTERDARNHMAKVKRTELKEGDAQAMLAYFRKMHAYNPRFFHDYDVDDQNRLRNVFWADARSIEAFKEFGDVVTFDTTYLVNSYDMPFAPFVGVNHHGQTILLGAALITSEDTESFEWLFKTWLACMSGVPPNAIITDQDRAMQNAIAIVFTKARHRWCIWHILKKVPEKLAGYTNYELFRPKLLNAVWDSLDIMEFEERWSNVIDTYELHNNDWLAGLYANRARWVSAFLKDTFWAGMSTTQRSESINAFFDGYVHKNTTLKEFVAQYDNALAKKVEKEDEEDAKSFNSKYYAVSPYEFELQFEEAYTNAKFNEFITEMGLGGVRCHRTFVKEEDGILEWNVREDIFIGEGESRGLKSVDFHVRVNQESRETKCTCRKFEFRGMVSRHIIPIWSELKLDKVPDIYILRRWNKNVIRSHTKVKLSYVGWERKIEWQRYDDMCLALYEVANKAMFSQTKHNRVMAKLQEAKEENDNSDEENMPMSSYLQKGSKKCPPYCSKPGG